MEDLDWLPEIAELAPDRLSALASDASECSPSLRALTARFSRFLALSSPVAPGLACIGGLVRLTAEEAECVGAPTMSATGSALTRERAALLCLGETADLLSPIERPGDVVETAECELEPAGWCRRPLLEAAGPVACVSGFRCIDAAPVLLPADLCLRRPPARRRVEPAGALSSGVAAGFDGSSALCRAILELCERDAAALWWLGGRPGRQLAEDDAAWDAAAVLAALRGGQSRRLTSLIDITTELGVPAVAAVAHDEDGRGVAIGISARLSLRAAAVASLTEMAQMEIAAGLARGKLIANGPAALAEADRRHLRRIAADVHSVPQLRTAERAGRPPPELADTDSLIRHLEAMNVAVFATDLSRPDIGVPVFRALSPDLQPFSSKVECDRFAACPPETRPACAFTPY